MKRWFDFARVRMHALARAMALVFSAAPCLAQQIIPPRDAASETWRVAGDMRDPANREAVVMRLRTIHQARKAEAVRQARLRGLPIREIRPDGGVVELMDWVDGKPLYYTTLNAAAAISTGANLVRAAPYSMDGAGWTVGVWDATGALTNHQELVGRVTVKDFAYTNLHWHSTHVAGTLIAAGVKAAAKGMAPGANLDSYDWNDDGAEMSSRGASHGGEPGCIYLSNHSYGMVSGWYATGKAAPAAKWVWYGSGSTASDVAQDFGQYNADSSGIDSRLFNLPYYSVFWAAGNDRDDNPATGSNVALTPEGPVILYDPAQHPPGDGVYRGEYENIGYQGVAKNVVTIGAVNDAVTSGQRDITKAVIEGYSSWGPTDDGRIKPDLVANGYSLYSSYSSGTASYAYSSGTSMAAPNATGTAQLLLSLYTSMKPGEYMRASTLKGLLIHTADDLGTAGPDYKFGWGLVDAKVAADLICTAATNSAVASILESQITTAAPVREHAFNWDGVSPIRATLCWTDPAGSATSLHDSRTAKLVNNLNLRLVAPDGATHLPFVMPFVGTWTTASMSSPATTGTNDVDNVEQVLVASPAVPGVWKAVVTYSGTLANSLQNYALVVSGAKTMPPVPLSVDPDFVADAGDSVSILGSYFAEGADVTFFRTGHPDAPAVVDDVTSTAIACTPDLARMDQGLWSVRVENADGQIGALTNALSVVRTLARSDFEVAPAGWTSDANIGSTFWARVTTASHTPSHSYHASGPATRNTDNLNSPLYAVPANATGIRLRFWHKYDTEIYDGCVLEVSPGAAANWKEIGGAGSGASFVKGGYGTTTIAGKTGPAKNYAELVGKSAWTGNSGTAFSEVVIALETAVYAGSTLRVRWRLSTDNSNASGGWWVDTVGVYAFSPSPGTLLLLK